MTICFVSREFIGSKRAGGIATYVYDMAKSLVTRGHRVIVLTASDDVTIEESHVSEGIKIIKLSGADFFLHSNRFVQAIFYRFRSRFFYDSYRRKVARILEQLIIAENIDIIEFPEYGEEAKFWLKTENRKVPTITRFHGPNGHDRKTNTIVIKNERLKSNFNTAFSSEGITFVSHSIENLINTSQFCRNNLKNFNGIKKVIHNPIFHKERQLIKNNEDFIFTAGSFTKEKGFVELIEAVRYLQELGIKVNLVVAGKLGRLGNQYKIKSLTDKNYSPWLQVLGGIPREDLFAYYKNARFCCFPSYYEPFGLTCIEAMSVGGLVIGSSEGGMNEIITEGKDGFLVEPGDSDIIANKLKEILKIDKNCQDVIRQNAINKIKGSFSAEIKIPEMIEFYNSVIKHFNRKN